MSTNNAIGAAIALVTATGAAIGLVLGYFNARPAVAATVMGIVIGTGVAKGWFSTSRNAMKKS